MSVNLGSTITELIDKINSSSASIEITDKVEQGNASVLTSNGAWGAFKTLATSMNLSDVNAILNYFFQHIVGDIEIFNFEYNNKFIEALEINDTRIWTRGDLYFDYVEQDEGYSVTLKSDIEIPNEIEIPSTYNGKEVTEIGQSGFANSEIVSVIIPSTVLKICDDAFSGCKNLKTVTMKEGLTYIGHRAFKGCSSIENLVFPDSVTYIGHETLSGCGGIVSIVLPYIGNFDWKDENHFYEYPLGYHFGTEDYEGGVATEQEYYNFWDINDPGTLLETRTFYIPEGLRIVEVHRGNILHGAFQNCTGITKITLPTEIDKIGKNSFLNCENLEELIIPVTLQEIDYSAFEGCSNVIIQYYGDETKYRIENNCLVVVESGEIIFGNQNSEIPSSASSIGAGAFYGNTYFAPIKIPLSVTSIGSLAFGGKPVAVHVEAESKPEGWADDWCDENVTVIWGYTAGEIVHLTTELGDSLTDEQGNLLII